MRAALARSQQREKQSGSLVQDLTAMVKEQKNRIAELIKSKKDAITELKVFMGYVVFQVALRLYLSSFAGGKS